MPFNLLLLPLLGGFIFITKWNRLRYYTMRMDGQRLLLSSACAGAAFLFVSTLLVGIGESTQVGQAINRVWHQTVPFEYSGRAALAFLLGTFLHLLLNRFWVKDKEVQRVILDKADALEVMFRRAVGEKRLVAMTVKNNKVYVGRVTRNFNPAFPLEHINIVPVLSGYRDPTDKRVLFNHFYLEVYDKLRAEFEAELTQIAESNHLDVTNAEVKSQIQTQVEKRMSTAEFELVIPRGEIQSVNFFDQKVHEKHFQVNVSPPSA